MSEYKDKTPEQITDEDYKVAPTSSDKEKIKTSGKPPQTDKQATCKECGLTARNNQELQDHFRHAHKKASS
jgi:hypothetical protein